MAKKKANKGPKPVEAITHQETRANIPTADAHDLVGPDVQEQVQVSYPREIRSPMLVWKGKEELDEKDLQVDAPPIYIQEKIDPRVLIENLRKTAKEGELEPELTLFEEFDGLSELDLVEFYKHSANWSNRMILGDSLQVMASLAERERLRGKVQMIYIDPPYGIKFGSNWQVSASTQSVVDGKARDIAREAEQIKAFRDTWALGIHSYLSYLRDRLSVAHSLLSDSGSLFLQIGEENVHRARALLDEVFGAENFVASITTQKTSGATAKFLAQTADFVLWYSKNKDRLKYRQLYRKKGIDSWIPSAYNRIEEADGTRRSATKDEKAGNLPEGCRLYALDNLTSQRPPGSYAVELDGREFYPGRNYWKTHEEGMQRLIAANRVEATASRIGYVRYLEDFAAVRLDALWTDTVSSFMSDKVYVVQTNTKVVQRCMLMTTDPGDLVLDPTMGSATTAFVAEQFGRRWITIDSSRVAMAIARRRLVSAKFPYFKLLDSEEGRQAESELTGQQLPEASSSRDIRQGFVYDRVSRTTLKSIANSPDIRPGMNEEAIASAVRRSSETELLYDQPLEDKSRVRVSGPLSVESLSPHRNLSVRKSEPVKGDQNESSFSQTILDNLKEAGIQNGRKLERLHFDLVEHYAGSHVHAIGIRDEAADGTPRRVGLSLGPQYGTVSPSFVKNAAREASKDVELDLLCILCLLYTSPSPRDS